VSALSFPRDLIERAILETRGAHLRRPDAPCEACGGAAECLPGGEGAGELGGGQSGRRGSDHRVPGDEWGRSQQRRGRRMEGRGQQLRDVGDQVKDHGVGGGGELKGRAPGAEAQASLLQQSFAERTASTPPALCIH